MCEWVGACGARGGDLKWIQIFGMGRDLLEYLVVCGAVGVTLQRILKNSDVRLWNEFAWFRVGQGLL